ncbi:MAG: deoxyribonuclease IV [Eubacteriaceae bacterium]
MLTIGPHISIANGFTKAGKEALTVEANTFQFFTRNPRGGKAKAIDEKDVKGLIEIMDKNGFGPLLAHAPYTLNMCSSSPETRAFARMVFKEDLERLDMLPCHLYNLHPGNHTGQGVEKGIDLIAEILNSEMKETQKTTVLLEAMSGKGTEIGKSFEELKMIIDQVELKEHMGICIDTCHIFSGGYDIVNALDEVIERFDRMVGINYLKAIHLNDSLTPFSSHKDRHEKIGNGSIGREAFEKIVTHPVLKNLPFFLETPQKNFVDYKKEIELLRGCSI